MSAMALIILAGVVSFGLRAAPVVFYRWRRLDPAGGLSRFAGHASFALMGSVIFSAAYGDPVVALTSPGILDFAKLVILFTAITIAAKSRSVFAALAICLPVFWMAQRLWGN
jgi:hypothetical protein